MTREDLIQLIYNSDYCPNNCNSRATEDICKECAEKVLTEYERKLYNKALDDCIKSMREETCGWEYAVAFIESCKLEELKKGTEQ